MPQHIILFKTLIVLALFRLYNSGYFVRRLEDEKRVTYSYDEDKNTETEENPIQFNTYIKNDIGDITTGVEEIVTDENNIKVVCPYFKSGEIKLQRMVGVWRPAYYQVSYNVPCFKMLIRNITPKDRHRYFKQYGDFNEKVVWDDCHLEIKSSANLVYRKHFLQGCEKGFGVLENIIIEQKGNTVPVLVEETADQWLTINNLLLMKDCMTGDVVIFSSEFYQPKMYDVLEASKKFGNITRGQWACTDARKTGKLQPFDGEFESDSDLMLFE